MKASARHNYRSLLLPDLRNVHDETFTFLDVDGLVDVVVEPLDNVTGGGFLEVRRFASEELLLDLALGNISRCKS